MNQFIPTYRGKPKHTEPSTNSYAAAYGYDYGFGGKLKVARKDWLRLTFVPCSRGNKKISNEKKFNI